MFPIIFGGINRRERWNPSRLPGTPREWLAGPDYCYTDGSAAFTTASSQSLSVASNSTLQTGDVDFWVAGWVNRTSVVGFDGVVSKGLALSSGGEFDLFFNNTSNQMTWRVRRSDDASGPAVVQPSAFSIGEWAFVLAWHDATNDVIRIRLNDGTVYTTAMSGGGFVSTNPFRFGALSTVNPLNGRLASWAWGKSPPGGIASVISTISSRLYAGGNGIVYADTTPAERTAWGLVSWWDLVRSGNFTDSHGSNNLTNNNGVGFGAGLPRARAGDTDPVSAWVDRWQGTTVSQTDPLRRPTLRLVSGKWVVRFDGVNDVIIGGNADVGFPLTLASAYNGADTDGVTFGLSPSGGGVPRVLLYDASNRGLLVQTASGNVLYLNAAGSGADVMVGLLSGSLSSFSGTLRKNGTIVAGPTAGSGVASTTGTQWCLGGFATGSYAAVDIYSAVSTPSLLGGSDLQNLETYLAGVM